MHLLPNRNNTNFPKAALEALKKIEKDKADGLRYQQRLVHEYVLKYPFCRGILAYHKMGSGKTILAVSIAESLKKTHNVIILSSKSLQSNFRKDIIKYNQLINPSLSVAAIEQDIQDNYHFISTKNVATVRKMVAVNIEGEVSKETLDALKTIGNIDDSVIIVDEAHNLLSGVVGGSKSDSEIYKLMMKAKNIKIILLSGSPIVNSPAELRVAFNLLTGYGPKKITLFGESNDEFMEAYVDQYTNTIKNKCKFQNRIFGLVSYYGAEDVKKNFPEEKKLIVAKVRMSKPQYAVYAQARAKERQQTANISAKKDEFTSSSSYRVGSRQTSNFLYPDHAIDEVKTEFGIKQKKNIYKLTDNDFTELDIRGPKIAELLKNVEKESGKGLIYSQFVTSGVGLIARCLEINGYKRIESVSANRNKGYGFISGEIDVDLRQQIINTYNSEDNKRGEIMKLLLITSTGAEGLDLKAIRHVHILEPYWNESRIRQIIARAVRSNSHISLPENERNVQPYIYVADYPSSVPADQIVEPTTDIHILYSARKRQILNNCFLSLLQETSIECAIFEKNCRLCMPTNEELFVPDFRRDLFLSDPCKPIQEKKITVKEILIGDKTFYYSVDVKDTGEKIVHIFIYDDALNGYVEIYANYENYSNILNSIYEQEKIKPRHEYLI